MKALDKRTTLDLTKLLIFIVVTTLATSLLVMTIGNITFSKKYEYSAEFVDATGVVTKVDENQPAVVAKRVATIDNSGAVALTLIAAPW